MKTLLESLEEHCESKNIDILDFLREHQEEANFTNEYEFKKTLNKHRSTDQEKENPNILAINRIYYSWIMFFNIICDVPLKVFDIYEEDPIGRKILAVPALKSTSQTTNLNLKFTDDARVKEQISTKYRNPLKDFVFGFKSDLLIYDYINRYTNEFDFLDENDKNRREATRKYLDLHGAIYRFLEGQVFNARKPWAGRKSEVKYVRVLSLPITGDAIQKVEDAKKKGQKAYQLELKKELIKIMAVPLFNHVINCNIFDKRLSKTFNPDEPETHSGIYMLHRATRNNSYAIQNNMDRFLSEYYQYNQNGEIRLDRLHTASGLSNAHTDTVKIYYDEIILLTQGNSTQIGNSKFTLEGVDKILESIINELEEKESKLSEKEKGMLENHRAKLAYFKKMTLT